MLQFDKLNGYVFSKDKRILNQWGAPVGVSMVSCLAIVVLRDIILNIGERIVNISVFVFLVSICALMTIGRKKNIDLLSMRFSCENCSATNYNKHKKICLDMHSPFYISELPLILHGKNFRWSERYYLLSVHPITRVLNYEAGGLRPIKILSDRNTIILPANENTCTWVVQVVGLTSIPQYPKVAYLPKGQQVD